eukprot:GILI01013750.1.p1 GENE.GILI01013750.1~~GILI01013750.1.p1  ORF type:complete len:254 (-),score=21.75 GILI01013750.1:256-912(-)
MQPQPVVIQVIQLDDRRNANYMPGKLLHTVKMDQEALKCMYWAACCCKEELAKATYMDIYSNGVAIGKPFGCNPQTSRVGFHHFDDPIVFHQNAIKGEACEPCPYCLVNCCNCCGEVLVMQGQCCSGTTFFATRNECSTYSWAPFAYCCCPISVMYGLAPGEAYRAAALINQGVSSFRSGNWAKEPSVAVSQTSGPMYVPSPMTMPNQNQTEAGLKTV